jgi:hypothetical protein
MDRDAEIITEPVAQIVCAQCRHPLDVSELPAFTEIQCPECGATQIVPARLGPFLLQGLLGKGGMGAVYQGYDESLNRPVAVKVLLASLGADAEFVETFRREAQSAAALNHPNIVQIYSFGVEHDQPYMVMELLAGGRFDQMIARGEPLNEALVMRIGADVAEGLSAAHAIGLVHGDIKPENILLDNNGVAKVVDFGLARFKDREAAMEGVWGTPYYIAPEKVRRQPGDARADIYSLGATLFHAIAARPPFDGETPLDVIKARLHQPAPLLRQVLPEVNPEVEAIIARMLQAEPGKRYPTYASLLADMRKALAVLRPPEAPFGQTVRKGSKIILTKKKAGRTTGPLPTGKIDVGLPFEAEHAARPVAAQEGPDGTRRSERRGLWLRIAVVAGLLGVVGAGLFFGVRAYQRTRQAAEEAARVAAILKTTHEAAQDVHDSFWSMASNSAGDAAATLDVAERSSNVAQSVAAVLKKLTDPGPLSNAAPALANLTALIDAAAGTARTAVVELRACTNTIAVNYPVASASTNTTAAEAALAAVTGAVARVRALERAMGNALFTARKAFKEIRDLEHRTEEVAEDVKKDEQQAVEQKTEETRKAEEEAARKKEAEALAELTAKELEQVKAAREAGLPAVQQNRFKEAQDAFKEAVAGLKTDEAKQAAEAASLRYQQLVDLKAFLVASINAETKRAPEGYKYGWLVSGVPTLDVLGADDAKVQIKGRAVPWDQVSGAQVLRFIKHYVVPELPRKERALRNLAAAVYVYEIGAGNERALKLAGEQAAEAIRADAAMADDVKKLMPDLTVEQK